MSLLILLTYIGSQSVLAAPTKAPIPINSFECDRRSILRILWGCLATLLASSWVAIHPNIPPPGSKSYQAALTRTELMIWTILAPECTIYWAMRQWFGARKLQRIYKSEGWTMTHGFFLQMGGFVLAEGTEMKEILSPNRLEALLRRKVVVLPSVAEEEIHHRSKADALSKVLVAVQVTWFITQYSARAVQGLATTQLELVTLALVAMNGVKYLFWWNKPFNVRLHIPVYMLSTKPHVASTVYATVDFNDACSIQLDPPSESESTPLPIASTIKAAVIERLQLLSGYEDDPAVPKMAIPIFFSSQISDKDHVMLSITAAAVGVIFGAIHCIGWSFLFPSMIEEQIWKISSLVVLAYPAAQLILMLPAFMSTHASKTKLGTDIGDIADEVWRMGSTLFMCLIPFYIIARLIIVAETFAALRDIPHSATTVIKWTTFLPHL